jgi:hypothetical protein
VCADPAVEGAWSEEKLGQTHSMECGSGAFECLLMDG